MQEISGSDSFAYWYGDHGDPVTRAIVVLRAVRRFRKADVEMRHRTQRAMAMNETDLLAVRHLIHEGRTETAVSPTSLAAVLEISSAATAKLLARLEGLGYVRRVPNPSDRRAQLLSATPSAHEHMRRTLGAEHQRMLEVAERLSPAEQRTIIAFLDNLSTTLSPESPGSPDSGARSDSGTTV